MAGKIPKSPGSFLEQRFLLEEFVELIISGLERFELASIELVQSKDKDMLYPRLVRRLETPDVIGITRTVGGQRRAGLTRPQLSYHSLK